jgi:predicted DNA-binding antitoxin AbrB/MazE fold protein
MREQIEVIYENGVLRPVTSLPRPFGEHQHLLVTIEWPDGADNWLDEANPSVSLEAVRQALAKASTTLARAVSSEREER